MYIYVFQLAEKWLVLKCARLCFANTEMTVDIFVQMIAVGLWPSDAKYSLQIIIWRRVTQQNKVTRLAGTGKRTVYKEPSYLVYLVFYRMIVAWCQNGAKTQKDLIFWKAYIEKLQE